MRSTALTWLLALVLCGCGLAHPAIGELIERDIASYGSDYAIAGLHEVRRVMIDSDTFALVLGTSAEGRQSIGLLGYRPDGTGFISTWDEAEPGAMISFAQDAEGVGDGTGATVWTTRACGMVSDPRAVVARVTTEDGARTEIEVRVPGYVFEVPATEAGIVRAEFVDATGATVASFPIDR